MNLSRNAAASANRRIFAGSYHIDHGLGSIVQSVRLFRSRVFLSPTTGEVSPQTTFNADGRRFNSTKREPQKPWNEKLQALAEILQHPPEAVNGLLMRGKSLLGGNEESMAKTWKVLQTHGFGMGALNEYPKLLLETPASVENYILIMKETGFHTIRPHMIMKFREMSGMSVNALKHTRYISEKTDVLGNYFRILKMPPEFEADVRKAMGKYDENQPLVEIRMFLLIHYLSKRLESPLLQMKNAMAKNPRNRNRCFEWIAKIIDVLIKDLDFPKDKIRKHTYLIQCDPMRLKEIMTTVPSLGGKSIVEIAKSRPKILTSTAATLSEIDRLFQQSGISTAAIAKYPEIYTLSSNTIKERLQALDKIPQFTTFKSHPRVARIIYYQNKVKQRIKKLEAMGVHGVSLHILSTDTQRFAKFIEFGEMSNKGADIIHFVSHYLGNGVDRAQVRQNFLVHPNWLHVPVVQVRRTLQFLRETKAYSVDQILKSLPLVLYSVEKIEEAMEKVKESGEAEEGDEYYLQMVLYFLESPGHFSGDGVFPTKRLNRDEIAEMKGETDPESNLKDLGHMFENQERTGVHGQLNMIGRKLSESKIVECEDDEDLTDNDNDSESGSDFDEDISDLEVGSLRPGRI